MAAFPTNSIDLASPKELGILLFDILILIVRVREEKVEGMDFKF